MNKLAKNISTTLLILVFLLSTVTTYAKPPEEHNVMLTSSGAQERKYGDITYYEGSDGTNYAIVPENGTCWVKCGDTWYGIDNSEGVFKPNSTFWVKRVSESRDGEEYFAWYNTLDDETLKKFSGHPDIIKFGVLDEDRIEYTSFKKSTAKLYVQLGTDFDNSDFKECYIPLEKDEAFVFDIISLKKPVSGSYAAVQLRSFGGCFALNSNNSVGSIISNNPCIYIVIAGLIVAAAAVVIVVRKKKAAK